MSTVVRVRNKRTLAEWDEKFPDKHFATLLRAQEWAAETVAVFNATLRAGEDEREVLGVVITSERPSHDWLRVSVVSQIDEDGSPYERMQCQSCGALGRKPILAAIGNTRLDPLYALTARNWRCDEFNEKLREHNERNARRRDRRAKLGIKH